MLVEKKRAQQHYRAKTKMKQTIILLLLILLMEIDREKTKQMK